MTQDVKDDHYLDRKASEVPLPEGDCGRNGGNEHTAAESELDMEILKAAAEPQIYQVFNVQDARDPDAVTCGEGIGIVAGENCVIKGKKASGLSEGVGSGGGGPEPLE